MDKLDGLLKEIREGPKYNSPWDWTRAIDAYKTEHGTTRGFALKGESLQFTDFKGQVWKYAHGARGGPGRPRTLEATQRFLKNRADSVNRNKLTIKDYVKAFGEKTGRELYQTHRNELKNIKATNRNNPGFDADHIRPASEGGAELPKTYRMQNRSRNRSQQAREITPAQRRLLMMEGTPKQQLTTQGPKPTPRVRPGITRGTHIGGDHLGIKSSTTDFYHNPFGIPVYIP